MIGYASPVGADAALRLETLVRNGDLTGAAVAFAELEANAEPLQQALSQWLES